MKVRAGSAGPARESAMTDQRKAYAHAMVAVLLWSTVASAFKLSLRYLDCAQLLLYSSVTATVIV